MSVRTDIVNLVVNVNGNQAKKEYYELDAAAFKLREKLKGLKKGTQEYIDANNELQLVQDKMKKLRGEMDLNSLSIRDLRKELAKMKQVRDTLDPTSQAFRDMGERIRATQARMRELNDGSSFLSKSFEFLKGQVMQFGPLLLAAFGIDFVIGKIGGMIKSNYELSDALSKVRRTTGLTTEEVKELNNELKNVDTRTSRKELLSIADEAGRLGVDGVENVKKFVEAADQIKVSIGDMLGDGAITQIGKLVEVFKLKGADGDLADGMLKVGSAINRLGQESTASEGYLVDFTTRLGGVANQADISVASILGYGSTLDQLGISAEVSTTTLNQVIVGMFKDVPTYAKIAGKSTQEFSDILANDANEAFILFLKGLNGNNDGLGEFAKRLEGVSIDGTRGINVLAALAGNTELIAAAQMSANEEMKTGNSITNEFNIANETFAAKIDRIKKAINSLTSNGTLIQWLESAADWILNLLNVLKNGDAQIETSSRALKALAEATTEVWKYIKNLFSAISELIGLFENLIRTTGLVEKEFKLLDAILALIIKPLTDTYKMLNALIMLIRDGTAKRNAQLEYIKTFFKEFIELIKEAWENLKNLFTLNPKDFIVNFKKLKDDFKSSWSDIGRESGLAYFETFQKYTDKLKPQKTKEELKKFNQDNADLNPFADPSSKPQNGKPIVAPEEVKSGDVTNTAIEEKNKQIDQQVERAKQKLKELNDTIKSLTRESQLNNLDANQKELEVIYDKYQKLIENAKGYNAQIKQLEELRNAEYFLALDKQEEALLLKKQQTYEALINQLEDANQKEFEENLSAQDKEEVEAMKWRDRLAEQADVALAKGLLTKEQYDELIIAAENLLVGQLLAIREKYHLQKEQLDAEAAERDANNANQFQEQVNDLNRTDFQEKQDEIQEEREELSRGNNEFYKKKIFTQEVYQKNAQEIQKNFANKSAALERAQRLEQVNTTIGAYNNLASASIAFINVLTNEQKEFTKKQKAITLIQLTQDTASAIGSLLKASESNPANAVTFGAAGIAQYASGLVRILANIAFATKVLSSNTIPETQQKKDGGFATVKGAQDKRNYSAKLLPGFENGYLDNPSLVLAGEAGEEYFVNNKMLQIPYVKHLVDGIDALTKGRINVADFQSLFSLPTLTQKASGGFTSESTTGDFTPSISTNTQLLSIIDNNTKAMQRLNSHLDKGIPAIIPDQTIIGFQRRKEYLSNIETFADN